MIITYLQVTGRLIFGWWVIAMIADDAMT